MIDDTLSWRTWYWIKFYLRKEHRSGQGDEIWSFFKIFYSKLHPFFVEEWGRADCGLCLIFLSIYFMSNGFYLFFVRMNSLIADIFPLCMKIKCSKESPSLKINFLAGKVNLCKNLLIVWISGYSSAPLVS